MKTEGRLKMSNTGLKFIKEMSKQILERNTITEIKHLVKEFTSRLDLLEQD